ncbi:Trans-aconitate 2-methyltransferase [Candidatus Norongarragalina meridionalis]|nr:Trans-aconitate 2-methyltransferase [Candidatus Norongarragalina meridionalis]
MKGWRVKRERPEETVGDAVKYYAETGKHYAESNAYRRIQRDITLRSLMLLLPPLTARVLDAGCGNGFSMEILREAGYKRIRGFDISPEMIEEAKKKKFEVKVGDLRKIPYPARSFDAIISVSALQWVKAEQMPSVAREFRRVLVSKGKAVVQFYPKSEEDLMHAARCFKHAGLRTAIITENADNPRKRRVFLLLSRA